jgi:hypothetical protein
MWGVVSASFVQFDKAFASVGALASGAGSCFAPEGLWRVVANIVALKNIQHFL